MRIASWGLACRRRIFWLPAIRKATLRPACRSGLAARRRCCRGYLLTRRYPWKGCALAVAGGSDRQRAAADGLLRLGSFVYLLGHDIDMVQQDVPAMLDAVFRLLTPAKPASSGLKFPATDEQQLSRCLAVKRYRVSSQRAVCSSVTRPLIQPPLRAARIAGRLCSPQAAAIRGQWLWRIS